MLSFLKELVAGQRWLAGGWARSEPMSPG